MISPGNRFRSILYNSSARPFATGDLISLDIMKGTAQSIRIPALATARLFGDLKSVRPSGQGISMRVRRRVSGRIAGRFGHILIPQGMGFASRLMNKFYGRFVTRSLNNYFNEKVRYQLKLDGSKMTQTTKRNLSKQVKAATSSQFKSAKRDLQGMGVNLAHFNPAAVLRKIQLQMIGSGTMSSAAPIKTGRLRSSIILRGFTEAGEGLIEGNLTIGGSLSSPIGGLADEAPYWWKTVYGGYYKPRSTKHFTVASQPNWFGESVGKGLALSLPKGTVIRVDNGQKSVNVKVGGTANISQLQPPRPKDDAEEISMRNRYPLPDNYGVGE